MSEKPRAASRPKPGRLPAEDRKPGDEPVPPAAATPDLNVTVVGVEDTEVGSFKTRKCRVCSRTNPEEASYCWYDGRPLVKDLDAGPVRIGSLPFPLPFFFSDGLPCANFNELVLACNKNWEEAKSILKEGMWPMVFGGIGRFDLAAAARQAAAQPDGDQGLSQLLERLPADPDYLRPPRLSLDPAKYDLRLNPGTDRTFDLVIVNDGMLLLQGVAWSGCDWLVFGDGTPSSQRFQTQKMFQTRKSCTIKVHVLGHKLRAGLIPMNGKIVVETNGGTETLPVRVAVPIRPFPKGANGNDSLTGSISPRDVAVKAKEKPNEAATLFEQGTVKTWYASNGWSYPVEGPSGQGKAAVQQFFEALGLTKPPKLQIKPNYLRFRGQVGEKLTATVTLFSPEPKPVFGQARSDKEWLTIGEPSYFGNKVKFPIEITVPDQPGQLVAADIVVSGNGKQQFVVPVTMSVLPQSTIGRLFGTLTRKAKPTLPPTPPPGPPPQ